MIADAETVYPCPFCHGKSYIEISHPKYRVRCDDCSALGPIAYAPDSFTDCSDEATKLWNAYREGGYSPEVAALAMNPVKNRNVSGG